MPTEDQSSATRQVSDPIGSINDTAVRLAHGTPDKQTILEVGFINDAAVRSALDTPDPRTISAACLTCDDRRNDCGRSRYFLYCDALSVLATRSIKDLSEGTCKEGYGKRLIH